MGCGPVWKPPPDLSHAPGPTGFRAAPKPDTSPPGRTSAGAVCPNRPCSLHTWRDTSDSIQLPANAAPSPAHLDGLTRQERVLLFSVWLLTDYSRGASAPPPRQMLHGVHWLSLGNCCVPRANAASGAEARHVKAMWTAYGSVRPMASGTNTSALWTLRGGEARRGWDAASWQPARQRHQHWGGSALVWHLQGIREGRTGGTSRPWTAVVLKASCPEHHSAALVGCRLAWYTGGMPVWP